MSIKCVGLISEASHLHFHYIMMIYCQRHTVKYKNISGVGKNPQHIGISGKKTFLEWYFAETFFGRSRQSHPEALIQVKPQETNIAWHFQENTDAERPLKHSTQNIKSKRDRTQRTALGRRNLDGLSIKVLGGLDFRGAPPDFSGGDRDDVVQLGTFPGARLPRWSQ